MTDDDEMTAPVRVRPPFVALPALPFPAEGTVELRAGQRFAVDGILEAFAKGKDFAMVDMPTGQGKSLAAAELARRFPGRSFLTTPQTSLVYQMHGDPNFRAVRPEARFVIGRANYDCLRDRIWKGDGVSRVLHVDEASCWELGPSGDVLHDSNGRVPCRYKEWDSDDVYPQCEYYKNKAQAELAPTAITTLAYFVVGTARYDWRRPGPVVGFHKGRLSGRPLLVVDEAHDLEDEVIRFLTTQWHSSSYAHVRYQQAWEEWLASVPAQMLMQSNGTDEVGEDVIPPVELVASSVGTWVDRLVDIVTDLEKSTKMADVGFLEEIGNDVEKVRGIVADVKHGIPWIVRLRETTVRHETMPVLRMTPVVAAPYLRRLLWDRAERIVVMSGTFLSPKDDKRDLGLDHLKGSHIYLPSDFPPERSPILRVGAARFVHKTRDEALPKILNALWKVLEMEPGRGVVHTQSFRNVEEIRLNVPDHLRERLVLHLSDSQIPRAEMLQDFQTDAEPGEVLVSPSVTRGLDLPGDRGEWTVFLKCPWPDLSDERVKRRRMLADGNVWYVRQVLKTTVQGRGRCVRNTTDSAPCYLLDSSHCQVVGQNEDLLPSYIVEAIRAGDRLLRYDPKYAVFGGGRP